MGENIKPSELWCEIDHDETMRSWDIDECKNCGEWESKEILSKLGMCWTCDKRRN